MSISGSHGRDAAMASEDDDAGRAAPRAERRRAVRMLVVAGGVAGPRDLADRLAERGIESSPDELRADLRALGVVKVVGAEGPVLAVAVDRGASAAGGSSRSGAGRGVVAEVTADPDWKLQAVVLAVVLAFLLAGLVAWLLGP